MKQIISIHVGQAGAQIGNSSWQLFCLEHDITSNGQLQQIQTDSTYHNDSHQTFFIQNSNGKLTPRCIYIDCEPDVVDQIRVGKRKDLYNPNSLINGKQSAADNFSRGYYDVGKNIVDSALDQIKKIADNCEHLQGFMMSHSVGGGTGSGLGSLILQRLSADYAKTIKISSTIYPSPHISSGVLQPYNSVLATHSILQHTDICLLFDNQALYDISTKFLDIERPNYYSINSLITHVISSATISLRFKGELSCTPRDICTNLIPYPRIHFILPSYAPFTNSYQAYYRQPSVAALTSSALQNESIMAKCSASNEKYIANCMIYRGQIPPKEIYQAINNIKEQKKFSFVDWCLTGFKLGLNSMTPTIVPNSQVGKHKKAVCALINSLSVKQLFKRVNQKFDKMYSKRAFVHWFVSNSMQQGEFSQAREDLAALQMDYWQGCCCCEEQQNDQQNG